ncbi:MAG: apolipoprotein N-acyltransferase [Hyphomicrobiaceae bacterium]|jgi:apolipoprotein N-acyltransferase
MNRCLVAALCSAVLYVLIFPPFGIWPLVWIAPIPLARVLLDPVRPPRLLTAALAGLVFAWAASLGLIAHWTFLAACEFFDKPAWWAFGFTLTAPWLAAAVPAWFMLGFAPCAILARKSLSWRIVGFAACWGLIDLVRESVGVGNPWLQLGHGFWQTPALAGLAAVGGVPFLSSLAGAVAAAISLGFSTGSRAIARPPLIFAASLIVLQAVCGSVITQSHTDGTEGLIESIRIGAVQAALSPAELWDRKRIDANFNRYIELSRELRDARVDIVVWPENALPILIDADLDRSAILKDLARELDATVLVGAPRTVDRDGQLVLHNSVYVFRPDGSPPVHYDKRRLLPFLERDMFLSQRSSQRAVGYHPGVDSTFLNIAGHDVLALLCFEALYADTSPTMPGIDAAFILNLSNDSWFGMGAGPSQHFLMTGFRALEQGIPLIRVANAGPGGWFDSAGRAHAVSELNSDHGGEARVYDVPLKPRDRPRARPAWFGLAAGLCLAAALLSRRLD